MGLREMWRSTWEVSSLPQQGLVEPSGLPCHSWFFSPHPVCPGLFHKPSLLLGNLSSTLACPGGFSRWWSSDVSVYWVLPPSGQPPWCSVDVCYPWWLYWSSGTVFRADVKGRDFWEKSLTGWEWIDEAARISRLHPSLFFWRTLVYA